MIPLYRNSPGSYFAYKIRDKATVKLENGELITRNIYTHYVSNSNPVYCRHNGELCYVGCEYYNTDKELFTVSIRSKIRRADNTKITQ